MQDRKLVIDSNLNQFDESNSLQHIGIYVAQDVNVNPIIEQIVEGKIKFLERDFFQNEFEIFSDQRLKSFLDEEYLHGGAAIESGYHRPLHQMSSGEQKRALLQKLFQSTATCLILDELFDHIDLAGQSMIRSLMDELAKTKLLIQILHRKKDAMSFIKKWFVYDQGSFQLFDHKLQWEEWIDQRDVKVLKVDLPKALTHTELNQDVLVFMQNVSVSYEERPILKKINWTIRKGEFWQLVGPNGSGKSTLLSLICGDNPKGYGQELFLFGRKKGSGETVWDIKKNIGYFNASITLHFSRQDSIEKMIISGFNDSIGLYIIPSDQQIRLAGEWLRFLGLYDLRKKAIQFLPLAQQRMVMIARAMVKHPPLLILDEPTAGLDDAGSRLIIKMIQQISKESSSAILYVSHSKEEGLNPDMILNLLPDALGSKGSISS